jgi:hypothetical protein
VILIQLVGVVDGSAVIVTVGAVLSILLPVALRHVSLFPALSLISTLQFPPPVSMVHTPPAISICESASLLSVKVAIMFQLVGVAKVGS